jgi:hypothetical protein
LLFTLNWWNWLLAPTAGDHRNANSHQCAGAIVTRREPFMQKWNGGYRSHERRYRKKRSLAGGTT